MVAHLWVGAVDLCGVELVDYLVDWLRYSSGTLCCDVGLNVCLYGALYALSYGLEACT